MSIISTQWRSWLEELKPRLQFMPNLACVFPSTFWPAVESRFERHADDQRQPKLPPFCFMLQRREGKELAELDNVFSRLKEHRQVSQLRKFAQELCDPNEYRRAAGAMLELEVDSFVLNSQFGNTAKFRGKLPESNCRFDCEVSLNTRKHYIECTSLAQTEEEEKEWDQTFLSPTGVRVFSGEPVHPEYRVLRRVLNKGQGGQLVEGSPNILCLGLPDLSPDEDDVRRALETIFSGHPYTHASAIRHAKNRADGKRRQFYEGLRHDSRRAEAEEAIQRVDDDLSNQLERLRHEMASFGLEDRISGVILLKYNGKRFEGSRLFVNANACKACRLNTEEWDLVTEVFGVERSNGEWVGKEPRDDVWLRS